MVKDLTDSHLWLLYNEARTIAADVYRDGGAIMYTGLHGDLSYQPYLRVYDREKDPLGNTVEKCDTRDKRKTHWVAAIQTIGKSEPKSTKLPIRKPIIKIRAKLKIQPKIKSPS
jgi:hypothetical protein